MPEHRRVFSPHFKADAGQIVLETGDPLHRYSYMLTQVSVAIQAASVIMV